MYNIINYLSSNIDWCEDNFVYNSYIVEMFNSLSSFALVIASLFGIFFYPESKILYSSLIPIGITSAYFHGSLSLLGQLLDELSILFTMIFVFHYINNHIKHFINKYLLFIINFYQVYYAIMFPDYNRLVFFTYSFIFVKMINPIINSSNYEIKNNILLSQFLFFISVIFWAVDYFFCIKTINFHALWHIIISFTTYFLFKFLHYIKKEIEIK